MNESLLAALGFGRQRVGEGGKRYNLGERQKRPDVQPRGRRRTVGLGPVRIEALRLRRHILKPFVGEWDHTLEIEKCVETSGLKASDFSEGLREYRRADQDGRCLRRGVPR